MEEPYRRPGTPAVRGALASAATFALLAVLLAHSLQIAVGDPTARRSQVAAAQASLSPDAAINDATNVTGGIRPNFQFFIFVICDNETVSTSIYDGVIYGDAVTLEATANRDVIVSLLEGRETVFPPNARIFSSECGKREFADLLPP